MGAAYRLGQYGLRRDPQQAINMYYPAAKLGRPEPACAMGLVYLKEVQPPNRQKGITLIIRAAKSGSRICQYNLGNFYVDGVWVEKNLAEGYKWLVISFSQGPPFMGASRTILTDVVSKLSNNERERAATAAASWSPIKFRMD